MRPIRKKSNRTILSSKAGSSFPLPAILSPIRCLDYDGLQDSALIHSPRVIRLDGPSPCLWFFHRIERTLLPVLDLGRQILCTLGMKQVPLALTVLFLLFGCGKDEDAFPDMNNPLDSGDKLEEILSKAVEVSSLNSGMEGELKTYLDFDSGSPYTGWIKKSYESGKVGFLFECKNGKQDGLHTAWFENGAKMVERTWKAGVRDGPFIAWKESGEVDYRGYNKSNLREGKFEDFYSAKRKKLVIQYRNGKIWEVQGWQPDGTACPHTKLSGGEGLVVYYNEDDNGTADYNETYLNGEIYYGYVGAEEFTEANESVSGTPDSNLSLPSTEQENGNSTAP